MKFNIVNELMNYKPYNEQERKNVCQTLRFINDCDSLEQAFSRNNEKGHITGSVLVIDSEGRILLNHHKKAGIWIQFGGHSENETDVRAVALREAVEETGLPKINLKPVVDGIFDCAVYDIPANRTKGESNHKHYDINFLYMTDNTNFKITNESDELRWCNFYEALELTKDDVALQRMLNKYRAYFDRYTRVETPRKPNFKFCIPRKVNYAII